MAERVRAVLRHVSLEAHDIERSRWFYDRFLVRIGFRRFAQDAAYLGYTDGTLTVWVLKGLRPRVERRPPTGQEEVIADHLAFWVPSAAEVASIQADLEKQEVYPTFRAEEHPEFRPGYFSATWADPDQAVLEIYTVGRAKRTTRPHRTSRAGRATTRRKPRR